MKKRARQTLLDEYTDAIYKILNNVMHKNELHMNFGFI